MEHQGIALRRSPRKAETQRRAVGHFYRPELDVVRFIAFLLVFLFHTMPRPADFPARIRSITGFSRVLIHFDHACGYGLSLFFTLSAYLICELLLREREASGTIRVKQFYIRRILRIWPLYYLALAICLGVAFLPGIPRSGVACVGWFAIFLGAWYSAVHVIPSIPISPLWSISVEEQFYLLVPWVMKYSSRKLLYWFCVGIIIVANARLCWLGSVSEGDYDIWYDSLVQFECFAAGILLCLFLRGRLPRIADLQRLLLIVGCFSCWVAANFVDGHIFRTIDVPASLHHIGRYALVAVGCVMMLVAFLGVSQKRLPRWSIYLGRISFGLYVYHAFAIQITTRLLMRQVTKIANPMLLLKIFVELGLTILMAMVSYRYFETPFLKMKRRHALIQSQPMKEGTID